MAPSTLFPALATCFLLFLLYHESLEQNKVPIPKLDRHITPLGDEYCLKYGNSPVSSVPACTNGSKATQSPCPRGCMPAHNVTLGHRCDPYLWRFARLAWDDAVINERRWMSGKILGANVRDKTTDFEYKGKCKFMCPAKMCMIVEQDADPIRKVQYVDMTLFDCVHDDTVNRYSGVCTCGHKWSLVDPANAGRAYLHNLLLINYNRTIGLDRRLVFDEDADNGNGGCTAERYGHCSYNWPENMSKYKTVCHSRNKDIECVNRSANYLGTAYRNFQTKLGLWYGICDSKLSISDPFAKASRVGGANIFALLLTAITSKICQVVNN